MLVDNYCSSCGKQLTLREQASHNIIPTEKVSDHPYVCYRCYLGYKQDQQDEKNVKDYHD